MIAQTHIGRTGSAGTTAMVLICLLLLWSAAVTDSAPVAERETMVQIASSAEEPPKLFASAEEALISGILALERQPIAPDLATLKAAGDAAEILSGDGNQDDTRDSGDVDERSERETSDRWPYVDPLTMKVGWANIQGLTRGLSS